MENYDWKELINESYNILNNQRYLAEDTDELDDADLPIGMNPKEYHEQKAKMRSLNERIKEFVKEANADAKKKIKKDILELSRKLNKFNRDRWPEDNGGDKWLHYEGKVTRETLIKAFVDGYKMSYSWEEADVVNAARQKFEELWIPKAMKLLHGGKLKVYRGVIIDLAHESKFVDGLKYNMQERNSWSYNRAVAFRYMDEHDWDDSDSMMTFILEFDCKLSDTNLVFSAWAEGYWWRGGANIDGTANAEINLKKNLLIEGVKVKPMNKIAKSSYRSV